MIKSLNSILVAGVVATAMFSSGHTLASPPTVKTVMAAAWAPTPSTIYRFATAIKTQALRDQAYNAATSLNKAKIDTQLIYSPAYPSLETCKAASVSIAQLLGANVAIKSGAAAASVTYQNSDCMVVAGP